MDRGLDDLVEWLLTEIGFSGLEGFSALHMVKAVKTFYIQSKVGAEGSGTDATPPLPSSEVVHSQEVGESDIIQASVVWNWLTARNDVIVGEDNRFRGISLKEALDLSGYVPSTAPLVAGSSGETMSAANATTGPATQGSSASNEGAGTDGRRSGKSTRQVAPRLHLSEERLWKAITGHQPDLKKVPQFEWQALVAIASVRETHWRGKAIS
ncbi:TFIIIC transcription initiation factor complex subunits Tfc3 [Apiospora marii]|uniref:TFIIIC transcription initiation factor complex subunits Tfc3 n=1 Tax=Apiospora marii TaxID=335849 RepID=A0ABR1R2B0_9PEZI